MTPTITKVFDVSTCHVSGNDMRLTGETAKAHREDGIFAKPPTDLIVYAYEEGCFVFAAIEDDVQEEFYTSLECQGLSHEFIALLRLAKQFGCKFLQLDRDGETYDNLPTFKW
jgi:hypothetical protein